MWEEREGGPEEREEVSKEYAARVEEKGREGKKEGRKGMACKCTVGSRKGYERGRERGGKEYLARVEEKGREDKKVRKKRYGS